MADIVNPGQNAGGPIGALPGNWDIAIYRGDYRTFGVNLKDSNGNPFNLTGYTPKAQLKTGYGDREPVEFTVTVTDAVNGKMQVFISSTVTSLLLPGSYIWDLQVTSSLGETRTYLAGDVTVYDDVTK